MPLILCVTPPSGRESAILGHHVGDQSTASSYRIPHPVKLQPPWEKYGAREFITREVWTVSHEALAVDGTPGVDERLDADTCPVVPLKTYG